MTDLKSALITKAESTGFLSVEDIEAVFAALSSAAVAEREPAYWAVHSKTGMHIGLWTHKSDADEALRGYEGGTIVALYLDPPPVSELEAENARLRDERYVAVAAMVRSHERSEAVEARLAEAKKALEFYADPKNWVDTPSWDGDPECFTEKAIPVRMQEGAQVCDCGDAARRVREGGKVDG